MTTVNIVGARIVDDLRGYSLVAKCPHCEYENIVYALNKADEEGSLPRFVDIDTCPHYERVDDMQNLVFEFDDKSLKFMQA